MNWMRLDAPAPRPYDLSVLVNIFTVERAPNEIIPPSLGNIESFENSLEPLPILAESFKAGRKSISVQMISHIVLYIWCGFGLVAVLHDIALLCQRCANIIYCTEKQCVSKADNGMQVIKHSEQTQDALPTSAEKSSRKHSYPD